MSDIAETKRGVNGIVNTSTTNVWTYRIDAGDRIYEGRDVRHKKDEIRLEVNGPVEYAVDGGRLLVKAAGGKLRKLDLIKTVRKPQGEMK